eukprot:gene12356-biopygen8581
MFPDWDGFFSVPIFRPKNPIFRKGGIEGRRRHPPPPPETNTNEARNGEARNRGTARPGTARPGTARPGTARPGGSNGAAGRFEIPFCRQRARGAPLGPSRGRDRSPSTPPAPRAHFVRGPPAPGTKGVTSGAAAVVVGAAAASVEGWIADARRKVRGTSALQCV